METTSKNELVYVMIKSRNKTRIIKSIKRQIFAVKNNMIDHLIGNIYYTVLHQRQIEIIKEVAHCNIQPIVLTKFTFRHTPRKRKQSLFKNKFNLKDY